MGGGAREGRGGYTASQQQDADLHSKVPCALHFGYACACPCGVPVSYGSAHTCGVLLLLPLPLQLLQGELDSLKAERGKAQRKNLEVGASNLALREQRVSHLAHVAP